MSGTRPLLFLPSKDCERFKEAWGDLNFTQRMPRKVLLLTLLCLFVFAAGREVRAARVEGASRAKDLKRAEVIVSKLKRLEEAVASREPGALRKAASKV